MKKLLQKILPALIVTPILVVSGASIDNSIQKTFTYDKTLYDIVFDKSDYVFKNTLGAVNTNLKLVKYHNIYYLKEKTSDGWFNLMNMNNRKEIENKRNFHAITINSFSLIMSVVEDEFEFYNTSLLKIEDYKKTPNHIEYTNGGVTTNFNFKYEKKSLDDLSLLIISDEKGTRLYNNTWEQVDKDWKNNLIEHVDKTGIKNFYNIDLYTSSKKLVKTGYQYLVEITVDKVSLLMFYEVNKSAFYNYPIFSPNLNYMLVGSDYIEKTTTATDKTLFKIDATNKNKYNLSLQNYQTRAEITVDSSSLWMIKDKVNVIKFYNVNSDVERTAYQTFGTDYITKDIDTTNKKIFKFDQAKTVATFVTSKKITVDNVVLRMITATGQPTTFLNAQGQLATAYQTFGTDYIIKDNLNKTKNIYLLSNTNKKIKNYTKLAKDEIGNKFKFTFSDKTENYNFDLVKIEEKSIFKTYQTPIIAAGGSIVIVALITALILIIKKRKK